MKCITLSAGLILLAITGCTSQAEAQSEAENSASTVNTSAQAALKTTNEKPCLTNFAGSLAGCASNSTKQKRFVLVRSVAIPEN